MTKEKTQNSRADFIFPAIIFNFLGFLTLFLLFKGIQDTNWYKTKIDGWKNTPATVTDFTTSTKRRSSPTYTPIYQYEIEGKSYQGFSDIDSQSKPQKGQTIDILYNPKSPSDSQHQTDLSIVLWIIFITIFGILALGLLAIGGLSIYGIIVPPSQRSTKTFLTIPEGRVRKRREILTSLLATVVLFLISSLMLLTTGQIRAMFFGWKITTARVVEYEVNRSRRGGRSYDTIYQYQVKGEVYEGDSGISRLTRPTIGDLITIAYNPQRPWRSYPNESHNIFFIVLMPSLTLFFFVVSIALIMTKWRKKRKIAQAKAIGDFYEGYIIELTPAKNHTSKNPIHDILIEFPIDEDYYQTSLALPLTEDNFILYNQDPTPIPVYPDPDDFYEFLIDDNDIYAVANRTPIEVNDEETHLFHKRLM